MNPGAQHRRIMAYLGARILGATDEEIALDLGIPSNSLRPRRQELVRMGKVEASDHQRLSFAGHKATVWVACDHDPSEPAPRDKAKRVAQAAAPFVVKAEEVARQYRYVPDQVLMRIVLPMRDLRALVHAAGEPHG